MKSGDRVIPLPRPPIPPIAYGPMSIEKEESPGRKDIEKGSPRQNNFLDLGEANVIPSRSLPEIPEILTD